MQFVVLFSFYGATIVSVIVFSYAARTGKHKWAYLSAALAAPSCFFVGGYPSLYYVPVLFPLGILLGGVCIKTSRTVMALLLFAPYTILLMAVVIAIILNA